MKTNELFVKYIKVIRLLKKKKIKKERKLNRYLKTVLSEKSRNV